MSNKILFKKSLVLLSGLLLSISCSAWEPSKPVEFVIPAGQGGGADQMARMIQGIITKNNLMKQSIIPVNKSAGAGAEGFLAVKEAKGDPHKIIITLSNLFTTPLATGVPFNWKEMTPVAMLALDQFILWTNTDKPYKNAKEFIQAAKTAGPGKFKMGGTGSKQEDQILTVGLEKATGTKFTYLPFKGGGDVAVQLVGNHIDSTVNNPIEAVAQWRAGKLKALCVFDDTRMPYKEKVTDTQSWNDIPTCSEAGVPTDYVMLRGIFMPPGVTQEQVNFYIDLFKKVRETADWKKFMADGAFNQTFMTGKEYVAWLEKNEALHKQLMSEAGFLAK
ncbi:MAG: tripartite tricarboxylate transporter substrate binding protein [Betaproteobacteria bacterium]|nr:tripartite tricarboxylate transporter substrate binding protein [Betaproteobacteria bacterium]